MGVHVGAVSTCGKRLAVVNLKENDFNGSVGVPFVFHALFVVDEVVGCDLAVRLKEIPD